MLREAAQAGRERLYSTRSRVVADNFSKPAVCAAGVLYLVFISTRAMKPSFRQPWQEIVAEAYAVAGCVVLVVYLLSALVL